MFCVLAELCGFALNQTFELLLSRKVAKRRQGEKVQRHRSQVMLASQFPDYFLSATIVAPAPPSFGGAGLNRSTWV
jgi:hypothetical protein